MSAPVIRPIGPDEVELFTSFADASPLGLKPPLAMYLDGLHQWYRPEWSWVALTWRWSGRGDEATALEAAAGSGGAITGGVGQAGYGVQRLGVGLRQLAAVS